MMAMKSGTFRTGTKGLKLLGIAATLVLLIFGVVDRGLWKGIIFYVISILIAYLLYLLVLGIIGGAFTDLSKVFKSDKMRAYAGEYAAPLAAIALVFITSYLFHHLHYVRQLYVVFLLYMMVHVFLLFIDRKLTKMAYLWSSLVLTELVYVGAILFLK